jgi:hypothetical protein
MRIPGKRRVGSGYAILVVFLGLIMFALLYAAELFVSGQTTTLITAQGSAWTSTYIPANQSAINDILFPGLAIFVMAGAIIEIINQSQRRKNGGEENL